MIELYLLSTSQYNGPIKLTTAVYAMTPKTSARQIKLMDYKTEYFCHSNNSLQKALSAF